MYSAAVRVEDSKSGRNHFHSKAQHRLSLLPTANHQQIIPIFIIINYKRRAMDQKRKPLRHRRVLLRDDKECEPSACEHAQPQCYFSRSGFPMQISFRPMRKYSFMSTLNFWRLPGGKNGIYICIDSAQHQFRSHQAFYFTLIHQRLSISSLLSIALETALHTLKLL
jgi:hypothetical protein